MSSSSNASGPGSLAFNNPSSGKIDQQRKILEELEKQKRQLSGGANASKSGSAPSTTASSTPTATPAAAATPTPNPPPQPTVNADNLLLSTTQRAALDQAAKSSFGYFIAQDSSFGNTILPVIPRIPPPPNSK